MQTAYNVSAHLLQRLDDVLFSEDGVQRQGHLVHDHAEQARVEQRLHQGVEVARGALEYTRACERACKRQGGWGGGWVWWM